MDDATFWSIIKKLDWSCEGDDEAVIEPAVLELVNSPADEIASFAELLAQRLYQLDTEAHARSIGAHCWGDDGESFSPDYFLYVRCCAVANGQAFFENALANPTDMPKDMDFEVLLEIAPRAYEEKTGTTLQPTTRVSYETWSNQAGWANKPNPQ